MERVGKKIRSHVLLVNGEAIKTAAHATLRVVKKSYASLYLLLNLSKFFNVKRIKTYKQQTILSGDERVEYLMRIV